MSTKSLIGGKPERNARKRRRRVIKELIGVMRMYTPGTRPYFKVESLVAALEEVHNDSRLTGAQKEASFFSLLNRNRAA